MKQQKRKPRLAALSAALLLTLTGCGGSSSVTETAEQTHAETTTTTEQSMTQDTTTDTTRAATTTTESTTTTTTTTTTATTPPPQTAASTQPPVTQTQPTVTQTQPPLTQTQPIITTASSGSTRNAARIRTDWCRLMSALNGNMVIVKDGTGYYMNADSGTPGKGTVNTFDASDLTEVQAMVDGIYGLSSNGTVRRISTVNNYKDTYYNEALADWKDIASLGTIRGSILCGVKTDGTVVTASYNGYKKEDAAEKLSAWRNVVQINGFFALCRDGSILSYDCDEYIYVPYLQKATGAVQVDSLYNGNLLRYLTQDGRDMNITGNGYVHESAKNVAYIGREGLRINNDGTMFCYSNSVDQYGVITTWTDIAAACAGNYGIIARRSDGTYLFAGAAKDFEPFVN